MKTITIQIGNTDNRLTQGEWARFVSDMQNAIRKLKNETHFFGGSPNWEAWQNVAWIIVCPTAKVENLKAAVTAVRGRYRQESAAFTVGETQFV